jgi:hypothetical protein|tara:strand:+ start:1753 stop:1950 length:198 start_codon:yes stop_codon:yes gene_type:complete
MKYQKTIREYDRAELTWAFLPTPLLYFDSREAYNKVKHKDYVDVYTWVLTDVKQPELWEITLKDC